MNPRRVYLVFSNGLFVFFRERANLFWSFALPVGLLLIFSSVAGQVHFGEPGDAIPIYFTDEDGGAPTPRQAEFADRMLATGWKAEWVPEDVPPEGQWSYVVRHASRTFRTPRLVEVPSDFDERLTNATQLEVVVRSEPGPVTGLFTGSAAQVLGDMFGIYAAAAFGGPAPPTGDAARAPEGEDPATDRFAHPFVFRTADTGGVGGEASSFFLPNVIAMNILFGSMISGAATYAVSRSTTIQKRLIASPLRKSEWIAGGLLGLVVTSTVTITLLIVVTRYAYGTRAAITPQVALLVFLGILLLYSGGVLLARTFREPMRAIQVAPGVSLTLLFLSAFILPKELYPSGIRPLVNALPTTHLGDALRLSMTYGDPEAALVPLAIVLAAVVVMFPLAVRSIRWSWE
ncbi:MAG: ABC transporter permease [Methanobacteriota archaeon]